MQFKLLPHCQWCLIQPNSTKTYRLHHKVQTLTWSTASVGFILNKSDGRELTWVLNVGVLHHWSLHLRVIRTFVGIQVNSLSFNVYGCGHWTEWWRKADYLSNLDPVFLWLSHNRCFIWAVYGDNEIFGKFFCRQAVQRTSCLGIRVKDIHSSFLHVIICRWFEYQYIHVHVQ